MSDYRLIDIKLDERTILWRNADIEQERRVAIFDLLEGNVFQPVGAPDYNCHGPYKLMLGVEEGRLTVGISSADDAELEAFVLPLAPFRRTVRGVTETTSIDPALLGSADARKIDGHARHLQRRAGHGGIPCQRYDRVVTHTRSVHSSGCRTEVHVGREVVHWWPSHVTRRRLSSLRRPSAPALPCSQAGQW